jgi:Rieske Fe-S protein
MHGRRRVYKGVMSDCSRRAFNLFVCGVGAGLVGCGAATTTVTPNGKQLTLSYAQFPALAKSGGGVIVDVAGGFPLAVVRTGDATAVALSATCTHAACILRYEASPAELHCDCHGANFDLGGAVLRGPTTIPLPLYAATPGADAITVDLS